MIKERLLNIANRIRNIAPIILVGFFAVMVFGATTYQILNQPLPIPVPEHPASTKKEKPVQPEATPIEESKAKAKTEIAKNPPKQSSAGSSTTSGNATIVSDGSISAEDIAKLDTYSSAGPAINIVYTDTTGAYPNLGDTLKNYLNNTLYHKSADLSYMYEIRIVDCSSCDYAGLYSGSYLTSGSDIYKAYGYITLNVSPYKTSAHFEDYMKLVLSHEYGHHYTMYHKWVDLDIPYGARFPDAYYNIRPLSKATTAWNYSLGWANCDAEIIAEDYSYIFSGYRYHAMSGTYGLPSASTTDWIKNMTNESPPAPEVDTTLPSVSITAPTNGATVSGASNITIIATDNVAVTKVEFYIDNVLKEILLSSPYQTSINTALYENGAHTLKAKAFDANQNAETSISVTIDNIVSDVVSPTVIINQPALNPYSWFADDLAVEATGSDNVAVTKIEFYINNILVASEDAGYIIRLWQYASTPVGDYTLKAKVYDEAGNVGENSITINKS